MYWCVFRHRCGRVSNPPLQFSPVRPRCTLRFSGARRVALGRPELHQGRVRRDRVELGDDRHVDCQLVVAGSLRRSTPCALPRPTVLSRTRRESPRETTGGPAGARWCTSRRAPCRSPSPNLGRTTGTRGIARAGRRTPSSRCGSAAGPARRAWPRPRRAAVSSGLTGTGSGLLYSVVMSGRPPALSADCGRL